MTNETIKLDLMIDGIPYLGIPRGPDQDIKIAMLMLANLRGMTDEDDPVMIGFSKEALRRLYEALLENPPPPNEALPRRQ